MYRIDGISDRILNRVEETDNALNKYREAKRKMQESAIIVVFKDFHKNETHARIHNLINNPSFNDINALFRIIDKHLSSERSNQTKGIATYLMVILLRNLSHSRELWRKIILLIASNSEDVDDFNRILRRQSVVGRIVDVIEDYFRCLLQIGDDFFIDEAAAGDKTELYKSVSTTSMILIIHHLLNLPQSSSLVHDRIFTTAELSPAFIQHLKLTLRNMSL